jgi:hypothetical protein
MYFLPVVFLIVFSIIYLFFGEKSKWQQRRQKKQWQADIDQSQTARISNNNPPGGAGR